MVAFAALKALFAPAISKLINEIAFADKPYFMEAFSKESTKLFLSFLTFSNKGPQVTIDILYSFAIANLTN